MKANELRLGNWVIDANNEKRKIICLDSQWDYGHLKPIKLTEEILLKCGFEKLERQGMYSHDELDYEVEKLGNCFAFCIWNEESPATTNFIMHSEYLHEFQNNFFALSRKELPINL